MDELPPLHALRCFEAAARHGSMTEAARELSLTHGAISRQVRRVEDDLGAPLFVRGNRRLTLTREGAALAQSTARALELLKDGLADVRRLRGGPLVLSCEPTLTLAWLVPRLGRLGDLKVHVTQAGGPIDLDRESVDVALRRGDFDFTGAHAAPVMDEWLGPVCCPRLARRRSAVLLHTRTRPDAWSRFRDHVRAAGHQTFDHFATTIQAAVAGLGMAIGPFPLVEGEIAAGRLVAPFGFVKGSIGYHLLSRRPFDDDARASRLLAWLRREAARTHRRLPRAEGGASCA
jgi:LysR family transcriptional regulator, glycine cleavage system transcriptional activator